MQATLYTWTTCPFCVRAKQVLDSHDIEYTEHVMDGKNAELNEVKSKYEHYSVPIILLDDKFIGGCNELEAIARQGGLGA